MSKFCNFLIFKYFLYEVNEVYILIQVQRSQDAGLRADVEKCLWSVDFHPSTCWHCIIL